MDKKDFNYNKHKNRDHSDRNLYRQPDIDQRDRILHEQQNLTYQNSHPRGNRKQIKVQDTSSYLLYSAHSAWKRKMDQFLSHHNLTNSQCMLLLGLGYLGDRRPEVLQNELTKGVWFDSSTASHAVRALEDAGLISRAYKEGDERSKVAKLTEKGKLKIQEVEKDFIKGEAEFFAPLKDRERDLKELLQDLLEAVEAESGREP